MKQYIDYEQNENIFFRSLIGKIENPSKEQRLVSSPFRKWKSKIFDWRFFFLFYFNSFIAVEKMWSKTVQRNILILTVILTKREIKYDLCNKKHFDWPFTSSRVIFYIVKKWTSFHSKLAFILIFLFCYYFAYQHLPNCRFKIFLGLFFPRYCSFQNSSMVGTTFLFLSILFRLNINTKTRL